MAAETNKPSTPLMRQWWQQRRVPLDRVLECVLGPLTLCLGRTGDEWQLCAQHSEENVDSDRVTSALLSGPLQGARVERYVFQQTSDRLRLAPVPADRPVVIRPRQPVFLPSRQSTTLFLSTPLFLRVEVGRPAVQLREIPMVRLSDTWFGPSTREGDLCYAGRTHARHSLGEVPWRPHRAITPLRIRNYASTPLPLEKISLPVPMLSVYGCPDGSLWTQGLSLLREAEGDMARVQVDGHPPAEAVGAQRLSGPREDPGRGLVRAFHVFFGI